MPCLATRPPLCLILHTGHSTWQIGFWASVLAETNEKSAKSSRAAENRLHLDTRKKTSSVEHCYHPPSLWPPPSESERRPVRQAILHLFQALPAEENRNGCLNARGKHKQRSP